MGESGHCAQNSEPANTGSLRPYILCAPSFSAIPVIDRLQSQHAVSAIYAPPDRGEHLKEEPEAAATAPNALKDISASELQPNQQTAGLLLHAQDGQHALNPLRQHLCQMLAQSARPAIGDALLPALECIGALHGMTFGC